MKFFKRLLFEMCAGFFSFHSSVTSKKKKKKERKKDGISMSDEQQSCREWKEREASPLNPVKNRWNMYI